MSTDMNDSVFKELVTARIKLLLEKPFFGNLAVRLILVEAPWCRTAATDGRHFYYNREFIKGLSRPKILFLVGHEVLHCFPPGTIIPGAFKPIEEMGIGEHVIGVGGVHSQVVTPMSRQYDGDLITVKARGLLPLSMTTEHPVLVTRPKWKGSKHKTTSKKINVREWSDPTWVMANQIKRGDWVHVPRVIGNISNHVMNFEFTGNPWSSPGEVLLDEVIAEFIGFYVAEGSTTISDGDYGTTLTFNLNERDIAERLKVLLDERFGICARVVDDLTYDAARLIFSSKPLGKWLHENCGHGSHNKRIPNVVLYNEPEVLAAFLRGYIGDGSVGSSSVASATVSKLLALQLQMAWARFGVLLNLTEDRSSKTSVIRGKSVTSGVIYRGQSSLKESFDLMGKHSSATRPTRYIGVVDDAIFTPVTKVTVTPFSGMVHNLETTCHTYAAGNMMTHNCVLDHLGRRGSRDPKIWNMAIDYSINFMLVNEKVGTMPEEGLYDPKYTDQMSADEIYALLKQNAITIKMPLDDHLDLGDDSKDDDGEGDDKGKQKSTNVTIIGKNGPPKLSEEDLQKIRNELKAAVIQTYQQVGAGHVPLGVKRMIAELVEPKMDWRTMLDAHIRSQVKGDYTFQRLSRRTWGTGVIIPAQNFIDRVECTCAIDASGSTTKEMVTDFISEVKGIMEQWEDFKILIFCFDTEVFNVYELTPENFDDIYTYEIKGGGGTLFEAVYEYLKREEIEPNRLVFLTDGLPNQGWGDPDYCDTIFIIHSNSHIVAPYGLTCHYENDERPKRH